MSPRTTIRVVIYSAATLSVLLLLCGVLAWFVWQAKPQGFAGRVCAYSPWMSPAYLISREARWLPPAFMARFATTPDDQAEMVALLQSEFSSPNEHTVKFAANAWWLLCKQEEKIGKPIQLDRSQQTKVVVTMARLLNHPDPGVREVAIRVLCRFQAREHLAQILVAVVSLSHKFGSLRDHPHQWLSYFDDAAVATLLITEHQANPCINSVNWLLRQTDPRVGPAILDTLRPTPGLIPATRIHILRTLPPESETDLSAALWLCEHDDSELRATCIEVFARSAKGRDLLINLRGDPTKQAIHAELDHALSRQRDAMSPNQLGEWVATR